MHTWTAADRQRIIELYPTHSVRAIARLCGWTFKSTENQVRKLRDQGEIASKRVEVRDWNQTEIDTFIRLYNQGKSAEYIAVRVRHGIGRCYSKMAELIKQGKIKRRGAVKLRKDEKELVIQLYTEGHNIARIAEKTGFLRTTVERCLANAGVRKRPRKVPRMMMCGYCTAFTDVRFDQHEGVIGVCGQTGLPKQRCDGCDCGGAEYAERYWMADNGRAVRSDSMQ